MDGKRFDALSREFASRQSRRRVLGLIGAVLTGGALLENEADAARRPPAPTPTPTCPGQQTWSGGQCTCPAGLNACGPACCNDDEPRVLPNGANNPNYSECCDGACCFGRCYGEELCCPFSRTWCEDTQECCPSDRPYCCGADGCCATPCCETGAGVACCEQECAVATDCPGTDSECATRTCTDGVCGMAYASSGTPVSTQIAGDCHANVCDGNGEIVSVIDDTDVPATTDDCTAGSCVGGVPGSTPRQAYTPCDSNGGFICDGTGQCVVCLPGDTQPCYTGPAGTEGVGVCRAGTMTCLEDGSGFGECSGEVLPSAETCNGLDDDCDGLVDTGIIEVGTPCTIPLPPGFPGNCEEGTVECIGGSFQCCSTRCSGPDGPLCVS